MNNNNFVNDSVSFDTYNKGKYLRLADIISYNPVTNKATVQIRQTSQVFTDIGVNKALIGSIAKSDQCLVATIDPRLTNQLFVVATFGNIKIEPETTIGASVSVAGYSLAADGLFLLEHGADGVHKQIGATLVTSGNAVTSNNKILDNNIGLITSGSTITTGRKILDNSSAIIASGTTVSTNNKLLDSNIVLVTSGTTISSNNKFLDNNATLISSGTTITANNKLVDNNIGLVTSGSTITLGRKILDNDASLISSGTTITTGLKLLDNNTALITSGTTITTGNKLLDNNVALITSGNTITSGRKLLDNDLSIVASGTTISTANSLVDENYLISGWINSPHTFTFGSSDKPIFNITTPGDLTSYYTPGNRFAIYSANGLSTFFLLHGATFGGSFTTLNLFGGQSFNLGNTTISTVKFSPFKVPQGFPAGIDQWSISYLGLSNLTQSPPTAGVWYNIGGTLSIPVGVWSVDYDGVLSGIRSVAGDIEMKATLSVFGNTESSKNWTNERYWSVSQLQMVDNVAKQGIIVAPGKTTYHLNGLLNTGSNNSIQFLGAIHVNTRITARSSYL